MVSRGLVSGSFVRGTSLKSLRVTPLYAGICACIGLGGAAHAQAPEQGLEEVVVTGSRIVRRDLNAPSPILTIDSDLIEQNSSVALEAVLNQYPQFSPGATQFTTANVEPNASSSPGASTLNMRNLGAGRSLVLLDGRRAQPVNAAMVVDVNTIPSAAIADVEIITGGAAATYGPDAMAGVVNFKLKRDFEGVSLNYQTGATEAGDGMESRADVLFGSNLGDSGNVMFSLSYADREEAWQRNRDFYLDGWNDPGTPGNFPRIDYPSYTPVANNLPSQAVVNQVLNSATNQSRTVDLFINGADGTIFRQAGAVNYTGSREFPYKIRSHNGTIEQTHVINYVSTPLTRYSAFGRAFFDVTDDVSLFAQGSFVMNEVSTKGPASTLPNIPVARNPDLEPAGLRALLDSRPLPNEPWTMNRMNYWFPARVTDNETKLNEFVVGLEGRNLFNSEWTWEAYSSFGQTVLLTHMTNFMWNTRYEYFLNQPAYGRGASRTEMAAHNQAVQTFTCTSGIPILEPWVLDGEGDPIFTSGFELTPDCVEAVTARMSQRNVVEQRVLEANFQGKLADVRAGELRSAFGVSSRENYSLFEPDALFLATVPAGGTTDVSEIYGELLYPVFGDFELEFGARYSDFETGGFSQDAKSYKALFNWAANDSFRFRGGWQRANRTPNVAELYAGPTGSVFTWTAGDACKATTQHEWGNLPSNPNRLQVQNLCAELIYLRGGIPGANGFDADRDNFNGGGAPNVYRLYSKGNPRLKTESADTYTFGLIWQAPEANLSVSADWYEIEIADVVGSLGFLTAYQQCFNADGRSNPTYDVNNEYCQTIFPEPDSGNPEYVEGGNFNLSSRYTTGIDFNVNWSKDLAGGLFGVRSALNRLNSWKQPATSEPNSPLLEYAGFGTDFEYQLFTSFFYNRDKMSVGLNWRYLPETTHVAYVQTPGSTVLPTDAYNLFNVNGSWSFSDKLRLRGGIDNLFNSDPPIVGANPSHPTNPTNARGSTSAGNYDVLGRRYYVGVAVNF
jgi:outer membrane receptor protein involved in Fe transport